MEEAKKKRGFLSVLQDKNANMPSLELARKLGFQKNRLSPWRETAKIWKCGGVPAMGSIKARNVKYDYIKYDDSGQPSERL